MAITRQGVLIAVLLAACAAVPPLAEMFDEPFYVNLFARMMIWAVAASSLNLILGYGGMVSFGHAAYLGIGAYVVGIAAYHDVYSGWVQWPLGIVIAALAACLFGLISLRTRGVYFIMITMALSQMLYYLAISAEEYGSDDGLIIYGRSEFAGTPLDLTSQWHLYYVIFAVLVATLVLLHVLVNSRFGMAVRGAQSNETRMAAMGFPVLRYRLVCFVIAGVICAVAGMLSANVEDFVSPDSLHWKLSGELIFMVVLGGMGTIAGPLVGAAVFWLLAEFLSRDTMFGLPWAGEHWHIIFGPFLILVVLYARRGIVGLLDGRSGRDD